MGRLLQQEGYSLQGTRTTMEGAQHPDRDAQFGSRNEQARAHLAAGQPVSAGGTVPTAERDVADRCSFQPCSGGRTDSG